jgi:predicted transcriptional regulator
MRSWLVATLDSPCEARRLELGLTQAELAERAGTTRQQIVVRIEAAEQESRSV